MGRRKVKRTKTTPVIEDKLHQLNDLKNFLRASFSEYESHILALMEEKVSRTKKLYEDKLKSIPADVRRLTVAQMIEQQEKENSATESAEKDDPVRSVIERTKMMSEKKRTLKKEKKRSVSANSASRPLTIPRPPTNGFSRMSRTASDTTLNTTSKSNEVSNMVVTPKFNPKYPVGNMARIPKPGELVMSLDGSPIKNIVTEGKVTLSLGGGKVLQLNEDIDLEKELKPELDDILKETFKNLKDQLNKILQS